MHSKEAASKHSSRRPTLYLLSVQSAAEARAAFEDAPNVSVVEIPINDGWARDWGPSVSSSPHSHLFLVLLFSLLHTRDSSVRLATINVMRQLAACRLKLNPVTCFGLSQGTMYLLNAQVLAVTPDCALVSVPTAVGAM